MTPKSKSRPELEGIAFEMRARLCEDGLPAWRMRSGLELALKCERGGFLVLTVKRIEQAPTPSEVAAVRRAFDVPETATVRPFARRMVSTKTHAYLMYRGIECRWWEEVMDDRRPTTDDEPEGWTIDNVPEDWTAEPLRGIEEFIKRLKTGAGGA
jgi:hypothetical protein